MKYPIKVLYIHHGSGAGGAANSLLYLLKNLDPEKYEAVVACNFESPKAREYFSKFGYDPIDLPLAPIAHTSKSWKLYTPRGLAKFIQWLVLKQPAARRALRQVLIQVKPDLVHLNGVSLLPLADTVKKLGVPVVQHIRESVNEGQFGIRRNWLSKQAEQKTAHIIYICEDGRRRFRVATENFSVIYDPVPFDKFTSGGQSDYRKTLAIPDGHPVIFFPGGSMLDIKGIIPFLLALTQVRSSHPNILTIIPGIDTKAHPRDQFRRHMEDIISENRLEEAIFRVPFSDNVEQYYLASDIVVAPFVMPHFSRAVMEAGAMARPIVGSRIGGIEEVLEDGKVGLLVSPNDATDLANKLCFLIENRDKAEAMGQVGYQVAREKFDAVHHAQAVMQVYDQALGMTGAAK